MKDAPDVILDPVVSEKSYALMRRGSTPSRSTLRTQQAVRSATPCRDLRRPGHVKVNTPNRQGKRKRNRSRSPTASVPTPSGRSSPSSRATRSTCSRRGEALTWHCKRKPTSPRAPVPDRPRLLRDHETAHRALADRQEAVDRRPQRPRPQDLRHGGGHKQGTASPTSAHQDGVPPPWPLSSTISQPVVPHRPLLHYHDGDKAYILAPSSWAGWATSSSPARAPRSGRATPCRCATSRGHHGPQHRAPAGRRRQACACSAGSSVVLLAKEGAYATLRLPSTEMRRCRSTAGPRVGEAGNAEHELIKIGKAGCNRWKGVRPQTRGVAMNPVDHPLGGGEGKSSAAATWCRPGAVRGPHRAPAPSRPTSSSCVAVLYLRLAEGNRSAAPTQEGPLRRRASAPQGRRPQLQGREEGHQDLVPLLDDHPRHGGPHCGCPRRAQARLYVTEAMVGHKLGEFAPHPHLPLPRRPGEGRAGRR